MRRGGGGVLGHVPCGGSARLVSRRREAKPGSASMRRTAAVKAVGSGATASMNGATSGAAGRGGTVGGPCFAPGRSAPRRGAAPSSNRKGGGAPRRRGGGGTGGAGPPPG